ncbi:hypothetical protein M6B38_382975 [Iris pallida]|uniref:Uncharacterized protein n=1 Tax=Iris pallida TaxID=29817 RepID=A0AAX6DMW1_IRIPA|nr:hypothetical protein M6B38_112500 [Iris pallida]KAJ6823554.1 hypothetical protein M6B38_382975 [Iris pallida]
MHDGFNLVLCVFLLGAFDINHMRVYISWKYFYFGIDISISMHASLILGLRPLCHAWMFYFICRFRFLLEYSDTLGDGRSTK